MSKSKEKYLSTTLSIRVSDSESPLGRLITYLETLPGTKQHQNQLAVQAWFMPFALDPDDEHERDIMLQAINMLEGQARAGRERLGIAPQSSVHITPDKSSESELEARAAEIEAEELLHNPHKESAGSMIDGI